MIHAVISTVVSCDIQLDEKRAGIDEIKKDTDILVERFIDSARTCEQFFLQKHLQVNMKYESQ